MGWGEVHRPALVGGNRTPVAGHRAGTALLAVTAADRQALFLVEPSNELVIGMPALAFEHRVQPAIARIHARRYPEPVSELPDKDLVPRFGAALVASRAIHPLPDLRPKTVSGTPDQARRRSCAVTRGNWSHAQTIERLRVVRTGRRGEAPSRARVPCTPDPLDCHEPARHLEHLDRLPETG